MPERQSMSVPNAGDDADAKHNPTDAGGAVAHPVEDGERKAVPPGLLTRVQPGTDPSGSPGRTQRLLLVAVPLAVLGFIYAADLIATSGTVPRGVIVAGVPIGGMTPADAEQRLRNEIGPRAARPVPVTFGGAPGEIDPASVGLAVDWTRTVEQTGTQPLNPFTRITSLFTKRERGVISTADDRALTADLEELAPSVDKAPVDGSVRFAGRSPVPVDPQAGQRLDVNAAAETIKRDWATGPVVLPVVELPAGTTATDVADGIDQVARPAVSGPVTVVGDDGMEATISEDVIASALTFRADAGELVPQLNVTDITDALRPQLAASEVVGRDAAIDFGFGGPVVVPSEDGRVIDYDATLANLLPVLTGRDERTITAVYADQPARFTTADLENLGELGVIGEFQTSGFATDSGRNIRRAAEQINGTVVAPGETFSLNTATNPRNTAAGYVEAGVIQYGRPARGVGGGVSQVATTLFNAAYFAGMVDVEHQEHSFYISRYPAGREATVSGDDIDVKLRNDGPSAVQIRTEWTPSSVTVRLLGVKRFEVTSSQSSRTNATSPSTVSIPPGEQCSASGGSSGFTITDTRTLREISTGESRTESHTVHYDPAPKVVCGG